MDDRFRIKSSSPIDYGRAFEDLCASGFYWYGRQVGRRPRHFLIASLILTCILAPGISKVCLVYIVLNQLLDTHQS